MLRRERFEGKRRRVVLGKKPPRVHSLGTVGVIGLVVGGVDAEAVIALADCETADAENGGILAALVDLPGGKILGLDDVVAFLHVAGVVLAGHDNGIARAGADAELAGGGLVITVGETMADAGPVHDVIDEENARIRGRENRLHDALARRKDPDEARSPIFHAVEYGSLLIGEGEEDGGDAGEAECVPEARLDGGEEATGEDGGDEGEALDKERDGRRVHGKKDEPGQKKDGHLADEIQLKEEAGAGEEAGFAAAEGVE